MSETLIQIAMTAVLAIIGWTLQRAVRTLDEHDAAIVALQRDRATEAATNDLRFKQLEELRADVRRTNRVLDRVSMQLAVLMSQVKLPAVVTSDDNDKTT